MRPEVSARLQDQFNGKVAGVGCDASSLLSDMPLEIQDFIRLFCRGVRSEQISLAAPRISDGVFQREGAERNEIGNR